MNNRQKELLRRLLIQEEGALHIKDLASELDCAEKTIRNDLDRLEEFLLEFPNTGLIRKPGLGISIAIDDDNRKDILHRLLSNEPKTMEERLFEMAFQLLTNNKPTTLQYWADRYYVPKAAVKKDIDIISNWVQRFDLELITKQRFGNTIEGSELKKRNALAHLSELIPSTSSAKNLVLDLFLPYEITIVRKALHDLKNRFSLTFTDGALESLLVHTLIMIKRTRQRAQVFIQGFEKESAEKSQEYNYTNWFFEQLESVFRLVFPDEERVYFTWHLMSSKRMEEELERILIKDEETTRIMNTLIYKMENLTQLPFVADPILASGLAVHMHSVINRIKYGFPITNPLFENIKRMYPYMFSMVILVLEELNTTFSIDIPEDEAAYIVLHFQASLERIEGGREEKKRALIVCHMGIGMSHLLEAKIKQQYQGIEILACISKTKVKNYVEIFQPDFIISTVPLENVKSEYIVISPLFGQDDKQKLRQFVEGLVNKRKSINTNNVLSQYLVDDLMFFNVEKEHRYEVVEMLARALFEKGYVKEEFIRNAIKREHSSATAIGGSIAIPHGDPSLIQTSAVATAILKKRMEWGSEQVSLVFMLAISKEDQGDIREVIGKIASLSQSPLVGLALTGAKDYQDFLGILEKKQ